MFLQKYFLKKFSIDPKKFQMNPNQQKNYPLVMIPRKILILQSRNVGKSCSQVSHF